MRVFYSMAENDWMNDEYGWFDFIWFDTDLKKKKTYSNQNNKYK